MIGRVIEPFRSSIRVKLMSVFLLITGILLATNLLINAFMNQSLKKVNTVYSSNITTNALSEKLDQVQSSMYEYLNTKSSTALENYYRSEQEYRNLCESLNDRIIDDDTLMLEKNIRSISESYLDLADETVKEKRGRNIEKYKKSYEDTKCCYQYINSYINELNQTQFKENSSNYRTLIVSLQYTEILSIVVMVVVDLISLILLLLILRNLIQPLIQLAHSANEVSKGNFETKIQLPETKDEVGILASAFESMLQSINHYLQKSKETMEHEQEMIKRQLLMETHLKDAQLKYLKAQINPHFLFNSLNAGAQLAEMEDAEQTSLFVQKMADFFRYNLKKTEEDATLEEEIEAVDNYIYILNVRFAGDIYFQKEIAEDIGEIRVPSMILQPIVENAVNHGIRNVTWPGKIFLQVLWVDGHLNLIVQDNGIGMSQELIQEVLTGKIKKEDAIRESKRDSTGVGLINVIRRLELYYSQKDLLTIESNGSKKGTKICIQIP